MRNRFWKNPALFVLLALPTACFAQTYQGPSGGPGGKLFDHWNVNTSDILSVGLFTDHSVIRCIYVNHREGPQTRSGFCDLPTNRVQDCCPDSFALDPDEFIIGIAGRYDDRIHSIRFFTNKRNYPTNGGFYGDSGGSAEFGYTAPSGQKIAAFIGRASDNLDAIGVLYAPIEPRQNPRPTRLIVWFLSILLLASLTGLAFMWYRFNRLNKANAATNKQTSN